MKCIANEYVANEYVVLEVDTLAALYATKIVFSNDPKITLKTKHAGDVVRFHEIAMRLKEQGCENFEFNGAGDGWAFLHILFTPGKTWTL